MTPNLPPATCANCQQLAALVSKRTRFRRGQQVLPFDGFVWQCPGLCADPVDGARPYQFSTVALMQWEETAAQTAWLQHFGVPMPQPLRGRYPNEQRTVRVPVLLTPGEADRLDVLRGDRPRGEFLRQLLSDPQRRAG